MIDLNSQLNILKKLLSLLTANAECHRRVINSSKCCHCHGRNSQGLCWRGCRGRYVSYLTFSYFNRLITVRSSPVRFMKAQNSALRTHVQWVKHWAVPCTFFSMLWNTKDPPSHRFGYLVTNMFDFRLSSLGSSLLWDHFVVFLGRTLNCHNISGV